MSKIYIVTSGEYCEYGIEAVFSTKGKAVEHIQKANECEAAHESYDIKEYCIDELVDAVPRKAFMAHGDTETGQIETIKWTPREWFRPGEIVRINEITGELTGVVSCVVISSVSNVHAKKCCAEQLQKTRARRSLSNE